MPESEPITCTGTVRTRRHRFGGASPQHLANLSPRSDLRDLRTGPSLPQGIAKQLQKPNRPHGAFFQQGLKEKYVPRHFLIQMLYQVYQPKPEHAHQITENRDKYEVPHSHIPSGTHQAVWESAFFRLEHISLDHKRHCAAKMHTKRGPPSPQPRARDYLSMRSQPRFCLNRSDSGAGSRST